MPDREFDATLHLLTTPLIADRTARFVDAERRSIEWTELLKVAEAWSTSERVLLHAALDMWGRDDIGSASLSDCLYTLDDPNFERVIEAMRIRRGRG